jgi:hypothetical protein
VQGVNLWVGAAAVLACGVSVGLVVSGMSGGDGATKLPSSGAVAAEAPQERVVVQRQIVVREPAQEKVVAEEPAEGTGDDALPAEEPAGRPSAGDIAAHLEGEFQAGASGDDQSRKLASSLWNAFSDPEIDGLQVDSLECRGSRCRVEVRFDDAAADRRVMEQLVGGADAKITMAGTIPIRDVHPDGSVSATMYLYPQETEPPKSVGL